MSACATTASSASSSAHERCHADPPAQLAAADHLARPGPAAARGRGRRGASVGAFPLHADDDRGGRRHRRGVPGRHHRLRHAHGRRWRRAGHPRAGHLGQPSRSTLRGRAAPEALAADPRQRLPRLPEQERARHRQARAPGTGRPGRRGSADRDLSAARLLRPVPRDGVRFRQPAPRGCRHRVLLQARRRGAHAGADRRRQQPPARPGQRLGAVPAAARLAGLARRAPGRRRPHRAIDRQRGCAARRLCLRHPRHRAEGHRRHDHAPHLPLSRRLRRQGSGLGPGRAAPRGAGSRRCAAVR